MENGFPAFCPLPTAHCPAATPPTADGTPSGFAVNCLLFAVSSFQLEVRLHALLAVCASRHWSDWPSLVCCLCARLAGLTWVVVKLNLRNQRTRLDVGTRSVRGLAG